eukprot:1377975-Rhodomonas_salina.1
MVKPLKDQGSMVKTLKRQWSKRSNISGQWSKSSNVRVQWSKRSNVRGQRCLPLVKTAQKKQRRTRAAPCHVVVKAQRSKGQKVKGQRARHLLVLGLRVGLPPYAISVPNIA